jgi:DNA-binding Xre family transcriptional regulator
MPRYKIGPNLFALKRDLEKHLGRKVPLLEIADATGLHRNTLERIANDTVKGVDFATLEKLLGYFQEQGMDAQIGDLFSVKEAEE